MFQIIFVDPGATATDPHKINFVTTAAPPVTDVTMFVMWIDDNDSEIAF